MNRRQEMVPLPEDLTEFLKRGRQLEYDHKNCECGKVTLLALGRHELEEIWIDGRALSDIAEDPNRGTEGYYAIPAVNLVADCSGYDPEHILSWLPESRMYCSWDDNHGVATVFPNKTWSDLAADPLPYLNAQWEPTPLGDFWQPLVPWPQYPFREGRPF